MSDKQEPIMIIAIGIAVGFGLTGLGFLLYYVISALGAIISGALATVTVSTGVITATGVGVAAAGGGTGVFLLVKVVKEADKKPFVWALPILAIVSGLVIDTCKELYMTDNNFIRIIYGSSVSGMFLLGGILWKQKKVKFKWISTKIISVIFFLIPPALIYIRYCQSVGKNLLEGFNTIPVHIIGAIAMLIVFLITITLLSWIFNE